MDDLLRDFLTESSENLEKLDNDLVELERTPGDLGRLNSVFRTIHTIKGTCGFLGLVRLEQVAHAAENVLDSLRAGRLTVKPDVIGDVLAAIDTIKQVLGELERTEGEPAGDDSELVQRLERWMREAEGVQTTPPVVPPRAPTPSAAPVIDTMTDTAHGHETAPVVTAPIVAAPAPVAPAPAVAAASTPAPENTERRAGNDTPDAKNGAAVSESTLRVGVDVLDKLMNLVGELALGRNQLLQLASSQEESPFAKPVQQLDRVTTDLLEAVMKTRMQPIGNAWGKLPRLVRDLAQSNAKQITLLMHGAETELDRQILQAIQDPLTHMVRNSADHGVESAAIRRAAGKSEEGTIRLSARHEGGHVVIEITDDGAGINVARVRRKAVERGLVKSDVIDAMPDAQVFRYIFEPGFSTAETITNVSGRGVGMDVVRSNIEAIGGTVELSSVFGQGTTVRIKIPLTLAIISALVVGTAGESFAVPQIGIVELVRVTEEQRSLVEQVQGAQFYRLRDTLLPLVQLRSLLRLEPCDTCDTYNIVVCQVGEARFGLVVDDVFDTQEIVVKPVGRLIKHLAAYAGCTITGDGRVIMILDTAGIAGMAGVSSSETREEAEKAAAAAQARAAAQIDSQESVLLFDAGYPALQAVPLSLVARLEEFPLSSMEEADGHFMVQYRGALMPVVAANPAIDLRAIDPRPVIVFSDRNRTMGLAVNEIRDIVEDTLLLQRKASRAGVLGVAVIAGRATEVIDTDHFLRFAHEDDAGAFNDPTTVTEVPA
jgi:two-component system chemotaxis sensor kinase CheA